MDSAAKYKPDIVGELVITLKKFSDSSMDEILALHIVNYLSHSELIDFLNQSYRVLARGGCLIIEGPDLEKILSNLNLTNYEPVMIYPLFATSFTGPTHQKPYINAVAFKWLVGELRKIGFTQVDSQLPLTHNQQSNRDSRITAIK